MFKIVEHSKEYTLQQISTANSTTETLMDNFRLTHVQQQKIENCYIVDQISTVNNDINTVREE